MLGPQIDPLMDRELYTGRRQKHGHINAALLPQPYGETRTDFHMFFENCVILLK